MKKAKVNYKSGFKKNWIGRNSNPTLKNQYWHQEIELNSLEEISNGKTDIALLGYVCDEGVRRNLGRVGAQQGPKFIREKLAKLPIHFNTKKVTDFGDIVCIDKQMEACQLAFSKAIEKLITQNIFPIAIGGGHDIAYAHYKGIQAALQNKPNKKIGIINFDAHFDLRPVETVSNSGTPFNQIISEAKKANEVVNYFAIGIQQQSNTKELFDIANKQNVSYVLNSDCETDTASLKTLQKKLIPFIEASDYLYITIDMDGFSSAYAPGVSAPSPLGFTPSFVFKVLHFLFQTNKVISCDIAELNPLLDSDNSTSILAARLVDFIVMELDGIASLRSQ